MEIVFERKSFRFNPSSLPSSLPPSLQGANPLSDIWAMATLRSIGKYFIRSVKDSHDSEAKEAMLLAATMAGVGFGSAGVHLAHGVCV